MKADRIRRFILYFLIGLSLVQTYFIWTLASPRPDSESQTTTNTASTSSTTTSTFSQSMRSIFGPSRVAIHDEGGIYLNTSGEIFDNPDLDVNEWQITDLTYERRHSVADYKTFLASFDQVAVLMTDSLIPFVVTVSMFESIPDEYYESLYNRIIVPIDDSSRVYFFNTQSLELYSARLSGASQHALQTLANNSKKGSCPAAMYDVGSTFYYLPNQPVDMPYQDYLVERLPNSLFIDLLFDDTSDVDMRQANNVTRYHDAVSELVIDNNSQELLYERQTPQEDDASFSEYLREAYEKLAEVENWTQELHYESIDESSSIARFRRYLEGLPVYRGNGQGSIELSVEGTELVYLNMYLTVAQTPIASTEDNYSKTMQSGDELLAILEEANVNFSDISSIRMGYLIEDSEESDRVEHYNPTWMIHYQGQWQSLESFIRD